MLFNSYEFILLFLPLTLTVYYYLGKKHHYRVSIAWLVAASLFFYGWWNPAYLGLILASMFFNYSLGTMLPTSNSKKPLLAFGVTANLAALGYYKYTDFFIATLNSATGAELPLQNIILPLAISFFTFQQVAFLVDAYKGETREYNFLQYALFVTFFPQLIAGPIVHHREMLPQFGHDITRQINARNMAAGLTIFAIGLFKKVMIADRMAEYSTPVFAAAASGGDVTFLEAWGAVMAYAMQIYFDFSGYVDMAAGAALLFGIRLPQNFNSPFKAVSIIDFWRRWHMTLSRFLRDYLYISLGGNRVGYFRQKFNLFATMLLGGLWHGAGWTYIAWGALHGFYLVVNHLWRELVTSKLPASIAHSRLMFLFAGVVTFFALMVSWVYFRSPDLATAHRMLAAMMGDNGIAIPLKYLDRWGDTGVMLQQWGVEFKDTLFEGSKQIWQLVVLWAVVWFTPNTQTIMRDYQPVTDKIEGESWLRFKPNWRWMAFIYLLALSAFLNLGEISEFLYFQF